VKKESIQSDNFEAYRQKLYEQKIIFRADRFSDCTIQQCLQNRKQLKA
jgi:hypothetical protein